MRNLGCQKMIGRYKIISKKIAVLIKSATNWEKSIIKISTIFDTIARMTKNQQPTIDIFDPKSYVLI